MCSCFRLLHEFWDTDDDAEEEGIIEGAWIKLDDDRVWLVEFVGVIVITFGEIAVLVVARIEGANVKLDTCMPLDTEAEEANNFCC